MRRFSGSTTRNTAIVRTAKRRSRPSGSRPFLGHVIALTVRSLSKKASSTKSSTSIRRRHSSAAFVILDAPHGECFETSPAYYQQSYIPELAPSAAAALTAYLRGRHVLNAGPPPVFSPVSIHVATNAVPACAPTKRFTIPIVAAVTPRISTSHEQRGRMRVLWPRR